MTGACDAGPVAEVADARRAEEHLLWPAAADALVPHAASDACAFYPGACSASAPKLTHTLHPEKLVHAASHPPPLCVMPPSYACAPWSPGVAVLAL